MHIILGLLGTIVTILVLLHRLAEAGIDLGGLNPYFWHRRRQWRKKYQGNPVYRMDDPMDATAILMVAAAKADGDMTREDKSQLLALFESDFHLSKKDATGLLNSSAHLLGDGVEVRENVEKFLAPSKDKFSPTQSESALSLIARVSGDDATRHENAADLLRRVEAALPSKQAQQATTW